MSYKNVRGFIEILKEVIMKEYRGKVGLSVNVHLCEHTVKPERMRQTGGTGSRAVCL